MRYGIAGLGVVAAVSLTACATGSQPADAQPDGVALFDVEARQGLQVVALASKASVSITSARPSRRQKTPLGTRPKLPGPGLVTSRISSLPSSR